MKTKILTAAAGLMSFSAFGAQVNFNLEKAIALGSGCDQENLSYTTPNLKVITGDRYLAIVTKAISLDLSSHEDAEFAERQNCAIRIPARVQAGHTIKSITQRAHYGVYKTEGATLALAFHAATIGNVAPLTKSFARDEEVYKPISSLSLTHEVSSTDRRSLCNTPSFIQKVDFSASAQLFSAGSEAVVGRTGTRDAKIEVSFEIVPCE